MAAILIENLGKRYKTRGGDLQHAVKDLSLEVREGEAFGFLGPNGAGKTTTILMLLNLIQPSSGSARLFGEPVSNAGVHRRLGYLPETVNLHDYYTGRRLLEFYDALSGGTKETRSSRITALLALLKLEDAANKRVARYSKGMLQRIGFAQALLHDPDLLILDEPTASLDPVGRKEFHEIIVDLKRRGKTIFISSHILSEVESVCDRVAILQKGELKRMGTLAELSAARNSRLVLKNVPSACLQAITQLAVEVTMTRDQVTVKCTSPEAMPALQALLQEHGVQAERMENETQSLEEIFFSTIEAPPKL